MQIVLIHITFWIQTTHFYLLDQVILIFFYLLHSYVNLIYLALFTMFLVIFGAFFVLYFVYRAPGAPPRLQALRLHEPSYRCGQEEPATGPQEQVRKC